MSILIRRITFFIAHVAFVGAARTLAQMSYFANDQAWAPSPAGV